MQQSAHWEGVTARVSERENRERKKKKTGLEGEVKQGRMCYIPDSPSVSGVMDENRQT